MKQYVVGDIGGTNARFARVDDEHGLQQITVLAAADYPHIRDAINDYLQQINGCEVLGICLAIAGPVNKEKIDLSNNHWCFVRKELEDELGIPLKIINDFDAQALCVDYLAEDQLEWLGEPRPKGGNIRVVLGPGTGLGVAALMPNGDIVPSEGGHVGFSPTSAHQVALLQELWERFGRVSVERLISGQGLENLYWANAKLEGREKRLQAKDIGALAESGEALALKAVQDMFDIFASTAGDMALAFWADDGVYLTGGVLEKLKPFVDAERFREFFVDKGRFKGFCESVPVAIINAGQPGLLGCYAALRQQG